jgi:serine/threonine-protein kinase HipA
MTRRFDRGEGGSKRHMQSLGALAHFDFNQPGAHSYEQAFLVMRRLGLSTATVEQLFRRMVFNVAARNQDDHVKNVAFLMDRSGAWDLAPAFDLAYAYRPGSPWTDRHQMTSARALGWRRFLAAAPSGSSPRCAGWSLSGSPTRIAYASTRSTSGE